MMKMSRKLSRHVAFIIYFVAGGWLLIFLLFKVVEYNEGGPVPYPISRGSFYTIGSALVNPVSLLEDVKSGKKPSLESIQTDFQNEIPFIMVIEWTQKDYLEIANALHKVIWKDDPDGWHLYRASFRTRCEISGHGFENADFYYYQDAWKDGKRMYSVRNIFIDPEYGNVTWGGDSFNPRPLWGWQEIDLKKMENVSAEEAVELADQQGGKEFRNKENNVCRISAQMWPDYKRGGWKVFYNGNTHTEVWIPVK